MYERLSLLKEQIDSYTQQVEEALAKEKFPDQTAEHGAAKLEIARQMASGGFLKTSLNLMRDNIDVLGSMPEATILRGQLLLETGKLEEGHMLLSQIAGMARDNPQQYATLQWYLPVAAGNIGKGNYIDAIGAWSEQVKQLRFFSDNPQATQALLTTLPLTKEPLADIAGGPPVWPLIHLQQCPIPMQAVPESQAEPRFMMAMAHLEAANLDNARVLLEGIISDFGENQFRGLSAVYLGLLDDNAQELLDAATLNLWEAWTLEGPVEEAAAPETSDPPNGSNGDRPVDGTAPTD